MDEKGEVTTVVMKDAATEVSISKQDITGTTEVEGATLSILDENGEQVAKWISTKNAYVLKGVLNADTTYTLHEENAPDGYAYAEDITFTIDKTGKVLVNGEDVNGQVTMYDAALGDVVISKRAVNGTEELEGASLKITDATGKTVAEWVSEKTPKLVQLDAGTYTLTEETAPDGYVLAESMTFTVDKNGKVTVKNENGEDVDAGGIIVMLSLIHI